MTQFDETYVRHILALTPKGLTRPQFKRCCVLEIRTGHIPEVNEAMRRYFAKKPKAKAKP